MSIEAWWPRLSRSTQQWLEDNNGDLVPEDVVAEITEAGGAIAPDAWWIGEVHEQGITLSTTPSTGSKRSPTPRLPSLLQAASGAAVVAGRPGAYAESVGSTLL